MLKNNIFTQSWKSICFVLQMSACLAVIVWMWLLGTQSALASNESTPVFEDGPIDFYLTVNRLYLENPGDDSGLNGLPEHHFKTNVFWNLPYDYDPDTFSSDTLLGRSENCTVEVQEWVDDQWVIWDGGWNVINWSVLALNDTIESNSAAVFWFQYFENDTADAINDYYGKFDKCFKPVGYESFQKMSAWHSFRSMPPYTINEVTKYNSGRTMAIEFTYFYSTPAPYEAYSNNSKAQPGESITVRVSPPAIAGYSWVGDVTTNLYRETDVGSDEYTIICEQCAIDTDLEVQIPEYIDGGSLKFRAYSVYKDTTESKGYKEFSVELCEVDDTTFPIVYCKAATTYLDYNGSARITANDVNAGVNTTCGTYEEWVSQTAFTCDEIGVNRIRVRASNSNVGSECIAEVTVADAISPIAACQSGLVELDENGNGTLYASTLENGSWDNCSVTDHAAYKNDWTHVVATWDRSGDAVLYVNGIEEARMDISLIPFSDHTATQHFLGRPYQDASPSRYWEGEMDDVQVFDRALTPAEVTELYNSMDGSLVSATPVAWWKLNETSGLTATDELGNSDATLVNFADNDSQWQSGALGNSLTFDGYNDYVTHNHSLGSTGTISHWLKPADLHAMMAYYESDSGDGNNGFGDVRDRLEIHTYFNNGWGFFYQDGIQYGSSFSLFAEQDGISENLSFTCDDIGFRDVKMVAYDQSGNGSDCQTFVEVKDEVAPVAQCASSLSFNVCDETVSITEDDIDNGSYDNCSSSLDRVIDVYDFDYTNAGNNLVTLTVTDESGLQDSCTTTVTITYDDADSDKTPDCMDNCPNDAYKTEPGICGCGAVDSDTDNDGTYDCNDICGVDPDKTEPGQCGCGNPDTDTDSDLIADCIDNCINDANYDQADNDNDTYGNACDVCPDDPSKIDDVGPCGCGAVDTDSDNDGTADCNDGCPNDIEKTEPGVCGCGVEDYDDDSDGTFDCEDECPNDPNKTEPEYCGCGVDEYDSDEDGVPDCVDNCRNDATKTEPGYCGCNIPDHDNDNDGLKYCEDNCPDDYNPDQKDKDGDRIGDACERGTGCNGNALSFIRVANAGNVNTPRTFWTDFTDSMLSVAFLAILALGFTIYRRRVFRSLED